MFVFVAPFTDAQTSTNHYAVSYHNKVIVQSTGFVREGTEYVPVADVVAVFKSMNIPCAWSSNHLIIGHPLPVDIRPQNGQDAVVYLNGRLFMNVPIATMVNETSNAKVTDIPIWYMMQVLKQFNQSSQWNGYLWSIEG